MFRRSIGVVLSEDKRLEDRLADGRKLTSTEKQCQPDVCLFSGATVVTIGLDDSASS